MSYPPRKPEQIFENPGLHVLLPGSEPIADIIAVHGLAANPWYTWTKELPGKKERVMWLRDLLPTLVPRVRVLLYSYDSRYLRNASRTSLREIGAELVRRIHEQREYEKEKSRPIIFLGHSFGGIVIEEALLYANLRHDYQYLSFATYGVMFLGTPHRGSGAASWAKIIAQCATVLGSDTRLLETIEKGSDRLESVIDDFIVIAQQNEMHLVCFYEELETEYRQLPFAKLMIVEKSSAIIEGYDCLPLSLDHCNLNKFNSMADQNFIKVTEKLKELVQKSRVCKKNVPSTPIRQSGIDQVHEILSGAKLPIAPEALFNSAKRQHDPLCLSGTRVDLLKEIDIWSTGANSETIYWLCGMAGTGKSTIARTVARTWLRRGQLGASFMFSRGHEDLSQTQKFVTTIAYQLSQAVPMMKESLSEAIRGNLDISRWGLHDQWFNLILQPLSSLGPPEVGCSSAIMKRLVVVIDALDECDNEDDIQLIIRLLESLKTVPQFRVFITSRPEVPIRLGFKSISAETHCDFILHDIEDTIVHSDVSRFLRYELGRIKQNYGGLSEDWPGSDNIQTLTQQAGKLFIYASTICRFIGDRKFDRNERLQLVLDANTTTGNSQQSATRALDNVYTTILQHSVKGAGYEHAELSERFRSIVGPIVLLFNPLSTLELAMFLNLEERNVDLMLDDLGSVIDARKSRKIYLLHPSFRDFLLDPSRCISRNFQINKEQTHRKIFTKCLKLISSHLRKDICSLRHPGVLRCEIDDSIIEKGLPSHVQYACRYWVSHLQQATLNFSLSRDFLAEAVSGLSKFFRVDFLHWVEALSLMNHISEGCAALVELEDMLSTWSKDVSAMKTRIFDSNVRKLYRELTNLIPIAHDAKRFLFHNGAIVASAPLQIYCAALIFCPSRSKFREMFHSKIPPWLRVRSIVPDDWDPTIHVCRGHKTAVHVIAFSSNSKVLASADEESIKIWDPKTGACQKTLAFPQGLAPVILFSPDGKQLLSAAHDNIIRILDVKTGICEKDLQGHSSSILSMVLSPDGKLLASASYDTTIKIWDPKTGACLKTMEDGSSRVNSVVFSPDNKLLASASSDGTVRIWDPKTGACLKTMEDGSGWVNSVVFSPDNKLLASASGDGTVRIWDPKTGACLKTMEDGSIWVTSVVFSPDNKLLALASNDRTVKIWDPNTGACLQTVKGHSDRVNLVVFSPDNMLLASASDDTTVKIWDPKTRACLKTMEGHFGMVNSVVFSPDNKLLASASDDRTVRIWDPLTIGSNSASTSIFTLKWKHLSIHDLASPISKIRFIDRVQSIVPGLKRANESFGNINSMAFSPSGMLLASVSQDTTIKIWDPKTGTCLQTMKGHFDWVNSVVFSPDNKLLASASFDTTVKIWDPKTGACLQTMEGHFERVLSVVFSPDNRLIASASSDTTVKIWDPKTGTCLKTTKGHFDWVNSVVFSPDNKLLASASNDTTVKIWNPKTGACLKTIEGHSGRVKSVVFSPDNKLLASVPDNKTVRIWDPFIGSCLRILSCSSDGIQFFKINEAGRSYSLAVRLGNPRNFVVTFDLEDSTEAPPVVIKGEWIQRGNEKLLHLPPSSLLKREHFISRNNHLAVFHKTGEISFFGFEEDCSI